MKIGRVDTLREGRGDTLETWEGRYTKTHMRVGSVETPRQGRGDTLESWVGRYAKRGEGRYT